MRNARDCCVDREIGTLKTQLTAVMETLVSFPSTLETDVLRQLLRLKVHQHHVPKVCVVARIIIGTGGKMQTTKGARLLRDARRVIADQITQ